jgi:hypothetical protein
MEDPVRIAVQLGGGGVRGRKPEVGFPQIFSPVGFGKIWRVSKI